MLKKNDNGVFVFEDLAKFSQVIHGFSTKAFGNLQPNNQEYNAALQKFADALDIPVDAIVRKEQVHGNQVAFVNKKDLSKVVSGVDALLTSEKGVFLIVKVADCIPLLLYDKEMQVVGVVHAGWRGLFHEIIKGAIAEMVVQGSNPQNIIAGIGPCICVNCYEVSKELADQFREKFPDWEGVSVEKDGKQFINLAYTAKQQLLAAGVLEKNIKDAEMCTYENNQDFYSHRKGDKDGRFVGLIGMREI